MRPTKKKDKITKTRKRSIFALIFTLTIQKKIKGIPPPYEIVSIQKSGLASTVYDCSEPSTRYLVSKRLKSTTSKILSFNIEAYPDSRGHQFIHNINTNKKMFTVHKIGENCYTPEFSGSISKHAFIILIIQQEAGGSSKCQITDVLTTSSLVPCSGNPNLYNFWNAVLPQEFLGRSNSPNKFEYLQFSFIYESPRQFGVTIQLKGLNFNNLDDNLVEFCLLEPLYLLSQNYPTTLFDENYFREFNRNVGRNADFAKRISSQRYFPRLVHDDLPGYLLGGYGGNTAGEDEAVFQRITGKLDLKWKSTALVVLFIEKPAKISIGRTYSALITTKEYFTVDIHTERNLVDLKYKIKIERTTTKNLKFSVFRNFQNFFLSSDFEDSGGDEYIYVALSVGSSVLYYTNRDNVYAKTYEMLTIYREGQDAVRRVNTRYFETEAKKIMSLSRTDSPSNIWFQVEYKQSHNPLINEIGLRVVDADILLGVVPIHLMTPLKVEKTYPSCFLEGILGKTCLGMARLGSPSTKQSKYYRDNGLIHDLITVLKRSCKVVESKKGCPLAMEGYNAIHSDRLKTHLFTYGAAQQSEYENMEQRFKDFYFEFTSNTNKKYLVPCPTSCKSLIFV